MLHSPTSSVIQTVNVSEHAIALKLITLMIIMITSINKLSYEGLEEFKRSLKTRLFGDHGTL